MAECNPTLSVVTPTYNRSALLSHAVESVFEYSGTPVEVIIGDDGSTDDTPQVCNTLRERFGSNRIVITRSEARRGAQNARNRALREARGDFVMFLDSDDVVAETGLRSLMERLEDDGSLDFVYGRVLKTGPDLRGLGRGSEVGEAFSDAAADVAGYHWHTLAAIYRRNYLGKVGLWNESLTGSQDWEYQARAKLAGGRGEFLDVVVGYWRQHESERVGTRRFRADYVQSTIAACLSILAHAKQAGRYDASLANALGRKLLVHAIEFDANGCESDAVAAYEQISVIPEISRRLRLLMTLLRLQPRLACRFLQWYRGD